MIEYSDDEPSGPMLECEEEGRHQAFLARIARERRAKELFADRFQPRLGNKLPTPELTPGLVGAGLLVLATVENWTLSAGKRVRLPDWGPCWHHVVWRHPDPETGREAGWYHVGAPEELDVDRVIMWMHAPERIHGR